MSQRTRILVAVGALVVLAGVVLGIEALRASSSEPTLEPGSIPIYLDGKLVGGFIPDDLTTLEQVSFVDAEEGKTQEGWLLRDMLLLHVKESRLKPDTRILVTSTSRGKSVEITWAEVDDPANWVMFDFAGRGTLKLVSVLERLDVRDEWVQDVNKIEIEND
ncbi:MAG: hypothetical protein A2Y73_04145 [Chloroflexi bacterium RBG_13_56_8]|nr:MAG: hypothetical protein A2Y73_04145 [Chloroflexi bacterium RBG_13_56_8]